jgi:hypothetical protein
MQRAISLFIFFALPLFAKEQIVDFSQQLLSQASIKTALEEILKHHKELETSPTAFETESAFRLGQNFAKWTESKQFRFGGRVDFSAQVNQVKSPLYAPRPYNKGTAQIRLTQPVLRGFLHGADALAEEAGKYHFYRSVHQTLHRLSYQVLRTVLAHWSEVYEKMIFQIERGLELTESFPSLCLEYSASLDDLLSISFENRNDLQAHIMQESECQCKILGARNGKLPQLDLYYDYDVRQVKGAKEPAKQSGTVGVFFSCPISNREEKGLCRRYKAEKNRVILETLNLKQSIAKEVTKGFVNHNLLVEEILSIHAELEPSVETKKRLALAEKNYLDNLAMLHFLTGSVLMVEEDHIEMQDICTLPKLYSSPGSSVAFFSPATCVLSSSKAFKI